MESLLRNGDEPGLLDGRAIEVAAQQYVSVASPDLTGRTLGRYDQIDGIDFITMEYVPGETLKDVIRHKGLPAAGWPSSPNRSIGENQPSPRGSPERPLTCLPKKQKARKWMPLGHLQLRGGPSRNADWARGVRTQLDERDGCGRPS